MALAYLILAAAESNWCWPAALISVILYIYICYINQLYLETILQFFYLGMAVYGWYQWKPKKGEKETAILQLPTKLQLILIASGTLISLLLGWYFKHYTNAALPYLDAFITVFSMITTWMVTRKYIENWIWWIVVDSAAAYLYFAKQLYITAGLFILYVVIVIIGYFKWKKLLQVQSSK